MNLANIRQSQSFGEATDISVVDELTSRGSSCAAGTISQVMGMHTLKLWAVSLFHLKKLTMAQGAVTDLLESPALYNGSV